MSRSFDIDPAARFTAGAVGDPGERIFFIQAWGGGDRCTLLAEKEQVAILAQALMQLIDNLAEAGSEGLEPIPEDLELEPPLEPEWRAGEMAIQYDEDIDRIAIVITEAQPEEDEEAEDEAPESARFVVSRAQARAMAGRTLDIVASGRPRCQFCGNPIDTDGDHTCTAMNGHRPVRTDG